MKDADKELLQLLKRNILNDIHITVANEEAFRVFRQKQLKAIDMYCRIWCDENEKKVFPHIHQVEMIYLPTANTVQMATCLEPDRGADHPVRQKLGEAPEKAIKKAVEEYLRNYLG
jgi:hypothetical protein